MIVVEDEDELLLDAVEHFVEEHVHGALWRLREFFGRLLHVGHRGVAEAGDYLLDAVRDVAEKDERVGVGPIQLIPDERVCASAYEVCDERGLARAGRRGDERDGVREVLLQALRQARAWQQRRRGARRQQLRAQEEGWELRHGRRGRLRVVAAPFMAVRQLGHRFLSFGERPGLGRAGGLRLVFASVFENCRGDWARQYNPKANAVQSGRI